MRADVAYVNWFILLQATVHTRILQALLNLWVGERGISTFLIRILPLQRERGGGGEGERERKGNRGGSMYMVSCVCSCGFQYIFPLLGVYIHTLKSYIQCVRPPQFMCGFASGTLHECSC